MLNRIWPRTARLRVLMLAVFLTGGLRFDAAALSGTVHDTGGAPIPNTQIVLLDDGWQSRGQARTDAAGAFESSAPIDTGYLYVQPETKGDAAGLQVCSFMPRFYRYEKQDGPVALRLPAAGALVLEAYDAEGRLMRWEDFERLGKHAGQFMYATNADDVCVAASGWPVHGKLTGADSGPREKGLPALYVAPGKPYAFRMLFWPVREYGKLMLRADNAGAGYTLNAPGDSALLLLNAELARTAVADLVRRKGAYAPASVPEIDALERELSEALNVADRVARAAKADAVLTKALPLRDRLELEAARAAIPAVRQGDVAVKVVDAAGKPASGCKVALAQQRRSFLFGVFEGSPYNAAAFEAARAAGFEYATVLTAWNWTESPKLKKGGIDRTFGISALKKLGYRVKAHGVLWMQEYGILPDRARQMAHPELIEAALSHQEALLDAFGSTIDIWEAMNEPANTNIVGLPREEMIGLLDTAARNIAAIQKPALVNSPHEFSFGAKYFFYGLDNEPLDAYPQTFSEFLDLAAEKGALDAIDIAGLQFYPGFHLNEAFANQQGPAFTPSYVLDTLERYARFGKTIHITELSLPSTYGPDWTSGYWREPWTEAAQADFAEAVYTLAFAQPQVRSVTWWDISDEKPSVISGGLLHADGSPKAVFERLRDRLSAWRTETDAETDADGRADFRAFGGDYTVTVTTPDGKSVTQDLNVLERWTNTIEVKLGEDN